MSISYIILTFINLILVCLFAFLLRYIKRNADLLVERQVAYEGEKGRNLATKEDIEDITRQIENIKAEISVESLLKKDVISERKSRLLNVLYYVEKILYGQNRMLIYSRMYHDSSNIYRLIDDIEDAQLELTHEMHIAIAETGPLEGINNLAKLVEDTVQIANEIITVSNNVAKAIELYNDAMKKSEDKAWDKESCLATAKSALDEINQYFKKPLIHKNIVEEDVNQYVIWLSELFGRGFNYKYTF